MKKLLSLAAILGILCLGSAVPAFAAGSTAIALNPSAATIRIGDTVPVTGNFSGSAIGTFTIDILYNAAQLQYVSAEGISPAVVAGELDVQPGSGSIRLLYLDNDGGLSGVTTGNAFRIRFKVVGGAVGGGVTVGANVATIGDANAEGMASSVSAANMTLAAPLSGNTFLKSLTVGSGTLTPAFSKTVYEYSVSVPFSVEKLTVTAAAEDAASTVTVDSPALAPAAVTPVTVTVKAPSGATKTYTIQVTRAQDPNYKAGSNANLKSLVPDQGILSPAFSPDITNYTVYLPYEITRFNAAAEMEDSKAPAVTGTEIQLEEGANAYVITGKAEDGTEKAYTVTVYRMPETGASSAPEATPTQPDGGFSVTISGTLTDGSGKPLAGMTLELHSETQVATTDSSGFYKFTNVSLGYHTLYVKDSDGIERGSLPIVIARGDQLVIIGNEITVTGDTTVGLQLDGSLKITAVADPSGSRTAGKGGIPTYAVILIAVSAMGAGALLCYFIMENRKIFRIRRRTYGEDPDEDEEEEGPYRIV